MFNRNTIILSFGRMGMRKMNQTGDGSNFVQIGEVRREGAVIVHQNIAAGVAPSYVQLEIDPDSRQRFPKAEVERRAVRGGIVLTASLFTSISAIFADYVGILSHFGIPRLTTTVASAAIALAGGLISRINGDGEFVAWRLRRPKRPNEPRPISLQRYLELDDAGNYLISSRTASCIYPKCHGKIIAKNLPPREVSRDGLAGVCSVAGNAHSYLIARNWVATPRDLDWMPLDPPNYTPSYRR